MSVSSVSATLENENSILKSLFGFSLVQLLRGEKPLKYSLKQTLLGTSRAFWGHFSIFL